MSLRIPILIGTTLALALGVAAVLLLDRPRIEPPQALAPGTVVTFAAPRPLPPLKFSDGNGHPLTLDSFKGRAVALNLWATWCVPCRKEMPSLDRLQARLGGRSFVVLPLSIDRQGMDVVGPFYRALGLSAVGIYLDPTSAATATLGIEGVPTTLLIGVDGREVGRVAGATEWDSPAMIATIRRTSRLPSSSTEGTN